MSLATLLLALAPAIFRPKFEPEKSANEIKLEARVQELESEIDRLLRLNERAAGRIQELEAGNRASYQLAQYQQAAQQMNQAQQNQLAAQQMQAMQNAMAFGQQILGAQAIAPADFWCNCVPARHDMLLRR